MSEPHANSLSVELNAHLRWEAGKRGWTPREASNARTMAFVRGRESLYASVTTPWLELVRPLNVKASQAPDLLQALNLASAEVYHFKAALDESDGLVICFESPIELVDSAELGRALDAMEWTSEPISAAVHSPGEAAEQIRSRIRHRSPAPFAATDFLPDTLLLNTFQALHREGWEYRGRLCANQYRAVFKLGDRDVMVYIGVDAARTCFQVPVLDRPPGYVQDPQQHPRLPEQDEALYRCLLGLNDQCHWAKWGIDGRGEILLCLDLPTDRFSVDMLRWATRSIAAQVVSSLGEVRVVCDLDRDPQLAAELVPLLCGPRT